VIKGFLDHLGKGGMEAKVVKIVVGQGL